VNNAFVNFVEKKNKRAY